MWWGDDHVIHSLINLSRMFFKLSTGTRSLRSIWRLYRKNLCNSLLYYSLTMQCKSSECLAHRIIHNFRFTQWTLATIASPLKFFWKKIYYIANIKTPFITHKKQYCPKKRLTAVFSVRLTSFSQSHKFLWIFCFFTLARNLSFARLRPKKKCFISIVLL